VEDEMSKPWEKLAVVYPPLPELSVRRVSVKFAKGASGSRYPRIFWFDMSSKKFRYLHSPQNTKDQEAKARDLADCEYEITEKDNPGDYKWDEGNEDKKYRLMMKFDKRPAGPVFFYTDELNEAQALKDYGLFCKRMATEENSTLESKTLKLLDAIWYNNASVGFNFITRLYKMAVRGSKKTCKSMKSIADANTYFENQKKMLLKAWANNVNSKARHFKPRSTIRLAMFLRTLAKVHNPNEELIVSSTKRILDAYEKEHEVARGVFNEAINEKANRRFEGMSAYSVYKVSPLIEGYAADQKEVPVEDRSYTKFDFSTGEFEATDSQVRIDYYNHKVNVVSRYEKNKIYGSVPIDDISSIVINEAPPEIESRNLRWLKVNGRKIKEEEKYGKVDNNKIGETLSSEQYIDPTSKFYALSVDSYLTKKTLIELKLHSIRLKDAAHVKEDLGTEDIKLRLKVNTGDIFWTSLPFVAPKMKGDSISCDFKHICRVRINPESSDYVMITLYAVAAESDKLPDTLKTLKKEAKLGLIKIPLADVVKQKKLMWIPLNDGFYSENPDSDKKTPMLAMSMRILKNVTLNTKL
jgi:hypothetical protein